MKILVTGGAGFIGSYLSASLVSEGHRVTVIDNLSTGRRENLSGIFDSDLFTFVEGNVCDKALMARLVEQCDYCVHLAAPVGVKYIMENPVLTILENVRGIDVLMENVHRFKKRVFIASTSEVYGKHLDLLDPAGTKRLKESDYRVEGFSKNHRWAYANTKSLDEFLAFAYHKEHGIEVTAGRLFNTVGPRQLSNYGMVIPNFVECALKGEDVVVYGSGEQRRSFLYVDDAVRAIKLVLFSDDCTGEVFNIGNPHEVSINELAQKIITRSGSSSKLKHISYQEAYGEGFEDMNRRTPDISHLQSKTGFELEHDLDAILDQIIDYHRNR